MNLNSCFLMITKVYFFRHPGYSVQEMCEKPIWNKKVTIIHKNFVTPLFALLYVFLFGVLWDLLYQFITTFRWDRDWPTSFQVAAGVIEGALVWVLLLTGKMPGVPK